MPKLKRALYWCGPSLLFIALYWPGLFGWFQMDDFAWLALRQRVTGFDSFLKATFTPFAQGTVRIFSERLFFMGMFSLFGLDAFPYHAVAFATQMFNLVLLALMMRRLTGSAVASFAAPVLWVVNSNIYWPVTWASAFNQILCSTVLIGATYLFIRFTETGARRYYIWQWIVFILGFGVLELVVVYPAITALYAFVRAKRYFKYALPMFVVSAVYTVLHRSLQLADGPGQYALHFDASMLRTLALYCYWALSPHTKDITYYVSSAVIGLALAAFLITRIRRRDWLPLFFGGWFLIAIGPYLPLRDHHTDYYLTVPSIGVAMLGGYALSCMREWRAWPRVLTVILVLAYAFPSAWGAMKWTRDSVRVSLRVQNLVERLAFAHARNPGKLLLLTGVDSELFWAGVYDRPYRIFGRQNIFLTEDTQGGIEAFPDRDTSSYFLADAAAREGIRKGEIAVYDASNGRLRNVTDLYGEVLNARPAVPPRIVDVGVPMYGALLGEGWHQPSQGLRWMKKSAIVKIGAPAAPGAMLRITGFAPEARLKNGPVLLTVSIDDRPFPPVKVESSRAPFSFTFPLPPGSETKQVLIVAVEVDRTMRVPPDVRDMGVVFGRFEIVGSQ
jgi:hypothetical protein